MKRVRIGEEGEVDVNMAHVLMLLSRGSGGGATVEIGHRPVQPSHGRVFECKTCSRQFPSFQALGGHRASHKKPRLLQGGDQQHGGQAPQAPAKPRVHECSVCGLEFAVGQALGGHMRRHRTEGFSGAANQLVKIVKGGGGGGGHDKKVLELDLNMPPEESGAADLRLLTFTLGLPVAVDCYQ